MARASLGAALLPVLTRRRLVVRKDHRRFGWLTKGLAVTQQSDEGNGRAVDARIIASDRAPRTAYQRARESVPKHENDVIVGRRCDVEEVLRHPELYSSAGRRPVGNVRPLCPVELDPPAHSAWRAALDPLFAPNQVGDLASSITRLAEGLIDGFAGEPEIDFTTQFSVPFPAQVLMTLLGLPLDDLPWLLDLKDGVVRPNRALGKPLDDPQVIAYQTTMGAEVYDYFGTALDFRQGTRTDDLLSRLLEVEVDGQRLSRESVLDVCFGLLVEGITPMSAALDCIFARLAEHPESRDAVAANPRQALEELLRWEAPVTFVTRTAVENTALGGCPISAGQRVFVLLSAANIDPVESRDADILRWNRQINRHLTFGAGIHRCLGSHLARLELSIALREWHARIPHYFIKEPTDLAFTAGVRTVDRFPMRLGRRQS
jgi:cytochrome P450